MTSSVQAATSRNGSTSGSKAFARDWTASRASHLIDDFLPSL